MNNIIFDPLEQKFPSGVVSKGTLVFFKLKINDNIKIKETYFMIREDNKNAYDYIKMKSINNEIIGDFKFQDKGHYFYNFKVIFIDGTEKYINKTYDNYSVLSREKGEDFVQIVTSEDYTCDNSMQGGIIYQIMVDRFCRVGNVKSREPLFLREDWGGSIKKITSDPVKLNTQVFGGNFDGVISKLDYLKNLGVTVIYFTPICQANSHHKYDTADYLKIDEMFGDEKTFKTLIKKAKEKGIKILIDGVYNHTGSDSRYFNKENRFEEIGAYNSKNSPYYNWYSFSDYPTKYESWWGIETLPSIKKDCNDFQDFIAGSGGVIEKYMDMGIMGIRLDVVDELTDEFTKKISDKIKTYGKDCVCLGEVWEDASTKISYSKRREYFTNNEINSVMNYPLKNAIIDYLKTKNSNNLNATIRMLLNNYPKNVLDNLMNTLGTHDTSRIFSELKTHLGIGDLKFNLKNLSNSELEKLSISENEKLSLAIKLLKIGFVLIFTLSGVPTIFYGDEYGLENSDDNQRACFDWENYENEIYYFVKNLAKIRNYNCLKNGSMKVLLSEEGKFVFERTDNNSQIIVMVNLNSSKLNIDLKGEFKSFFTNKTINYISLCENEFEILINEKNNNYL
ncbi:MAG: glycoside hydrolase family 13 protein [Clostridia bacterium]|nr:glycoside hydrolase family 13 protein [Clostridia bacterium]